MGLTQTMLGMGELPEQPAIPEPTLDELGALTPPVADEAEPLMDGDFIMLDDGSALIPEFEDDADPALAEFRVNLAEVLEDTELGFLGTDTLRLIEQDIRAREKRDEQYADGIKRTGLGGDAPGGADFEGASRAVHPMLAKGCVDFASRAIKELFPAQGPCRTQIIGDQSEEKLARADRKKTYMNWQLTTGVPENRSELERLLSQVPLGGSQYKRWWFDPEQKRPRTEAVFIDDIFYPYGTDFYTAPRVAYRQRILKYEFDRRVRTGLYRDLGLSAPSINMEPESAARAATDKVEGVDPDNLSYNEDGLRTVYEVYIELQLEDDPLTAGRTAPYVLHLDESASRVLGLYRNWKEGDTRYRKLHWMSEWAFIPWRGGPAVGLAHLIGSMSGAATGALRAILDAANIQNFPGAVKLKGGRNAGQNVTVNPTEIVDLEAPAGVDDIRKLIMPFPYAGPSQVLFTVLEWLTQQAEMVVATASEKIADAKDMPMGTALALIEHGSVNFSAIHARLHAALKQDLAILHRLNGEYLDDEEVVEELGELIVGRADFEGPVDIIPVSDPNIFSEAQRYAQLQAVLQLRSDPQFAPFFRADKLLVRALKLLQFPDPEGIANLPRDPQRLTPIQENYTSALPIEETRPLKVFKDQNHMAHMQVHLQFALSPVMGANPLVGSQVIPIMLQHVREHLVEFYRIHATAATEAVQALGPMQGQELSPEEAEAKGAAFADFALAQVLGPMVMPALAQLQELAAKMQPQPQATPDTVLTEQTKIKLKQEQLAYDKQRDDADRAANASAARIAAEAEVHQNQTSKDLAELSAAVQLIRDQQNNAAKQLMAEFNAAQEKQAMLLQTVLTTMTAPKEPGTNVNFDVGREFEGVMENMGGVLASALAQSLASAVQEQQSALTEILTAERSVNQAALAALSQGLSELRTATLSPRRATLRRLPDGTAVVEANTMMPGAPQQ